MGSSFEELVTRKPRVKKDHNFDKRFESYRFLNFLIPKLMHVTSSLASHGWPDDVEKNQHTLL